MTTDTTLELRTSRVLPATPEQVFDAYTDAEKQKIWFSILDEEPGVVEIEVDLRVGGQQTAVWGPDRDNLFRETQTFLVIDRPHRLVTESSGSSPDGMTMTTHIEVTFEAQSATARSCPSCRPGSRPSRCATSSPSRPGTGRSTASRRTWSGRDAALTLPAAGTAREADPMVDLVHVPADPDHPDAWTVEGTVRVGDAVDLAIHGSTDFSLDVPTTRATLTEPHRKVHRLVAVPAERHALPSPSSAGP